ncbi:DUF3173 domain-containing protein [Ligilactobacillus salivarius]|uniref:DUF3173 domain-containing protein n=1 Tax=Ligilactobacillus salivarius TaxID=1624 RepID=UPI002097DAFE|nr:DUF3173 domain-containing protein [Ligilactobacillus salivarius]MCO7135808.1 DUF3173 domain-containing protein [Ligilactobacillus salivarius]
MKSKKTITANELVDELGFKTHQARDIIRLAKVTMVNRGYSMYNNKRLGVVPISVIEEITGIPLIEEDTNNDNSRKN